MGKFADGTVHDGVDFSGKEFDSSLRKHGKGQATQTPFRFKLGDGRAIRGWEEVLKTMALGKGPFPSPQLELPSPQQSNCCILAPLAIGEELEVMIRPKWAYRKGGLQDEAGTWIVPPHASLVFQMQLVQVREQTVQDRRCG